MIIKNKKIRFAKLVAAGNDFVLIDNRVCRITSSAQLRDLARKMCDRKFGAGADGLLVLEKSKVADLKMRVFNADGSEAQMCGNGARCFAYYLSGGEKAGKDFFLVLETIAGIVNARVNADNVRINITQPMNLKLDVPLKVSGRAIKVNFINTGVPHAVIFVEGLEQIDVQGLGREIRRHRYFSPAGTNVNFVEVLRADSLKIRTYERGVEDETLACGTGSIAAALVASVKAAGKINKINVRTAGGEILKVYFTPLDSKHLTEFTRTGLGFKDVWLEGKAGLVYRGEYYV